jgi:hypothetical protein
MNPFRRIRHFFRKPAMTGTPPSRRPLWHNPAAHARDFSERYAEPLNYHVENRMMELGIHPDRIGCPDPVRGGRWAAFHPTGTQGGHNRPEGNLNADSGLFDLDLLSKDYGKEAARLFGKSGLRDRLDAIIAHEFEEHRPGRSHVEALAQAPKTELPISERARELCEAMRSGWKK